MCTSLYSLPSECSCYSEKPMPLGPSSFSFLYYRLIPKPNTTLFLTVSSPLERFYCTKHFMAIRFHESSHGLCVSLADMKPKFYQFQCGSASRILPRHVPVNFRKVIILQNRSWSLESFLTHERSPLNCFSVHGWLCTGLVHL